MVYLLLQSKHSPNNWLLILVHFPPGVEEVFRYFTYIKWRYFFVNIYMTIIIIDALSSILLLQLVEVKLTLIIWNTCLNVSCWVFGLYGVVHSQ